jgi:hypothetical protein
LAKRYSPETGTALMNHLFAFVTPERMSVFNIGVAEVLSLLVRKRNDGRLSANGFTQSLNSFRAEIIHAADVRKAEADNALVLAALPLIQSYSINATDAVILRSALELAASLRVSGDDLVLVAADHRLLKAARAEGLLTFDPETQTQSDLDALL